jgi:dTDP-glucose 4,6-dehydratase
MDLLTYAGNLSNLKDIEDKENYTFVKCDICDLEKVKQVFEDFQIDSVIHLAAESHVDRSIKDPLSFAQTNVMGTLSLLQAAKNFWSNQFENKLFYHVSTDEVYGDILRGRSNENYSYKPSSPYAASKASSDHLVYSYVRTYKIPAIVTNCSNNYGPKQHPEKLIPKVIYNIINNINLPIYGDGKNSREWIFVDDHCNALIKILEKGKIGEFYNIGSNKNLTNIQIIKLLTNIAKKYIKIGKNVKIQYVKDRPGHDFRYALNSNKIKNKLNLKPKFEIISGLKKTFLWYYLNQSYFKNIKKKDITKRLGNK